MSTIKQRKGNLAVNVKLACDCGQHSLEGSVLFHEQNSKFASSKSVNQTGGQLLESSWCMDSGNHWQYADNKTAGRKKKN